MKQNQWMNEAGLIETKPMDEGKFGLELLEKLANNKADKGNAERERRLGLGLPLPQEL